MCGTCTEFSRLAHTPKVFSKPHQNMLGMRAELTHMGWEIPTQPEEGKGEKCVEGNRVNRVSRRLQAI